MLEVFLKYHFTSEQILGLLGLCPVAFLTTLRHMNQVDTMLQIVHTCGSVCL